MTDLLDINVDLVHAALKGAGFEVTVSHCRGIPPWSALLPRKPRFDANIFLERVFPRWVPLARKNFLIPDQERLADGTRFENHSTPLLKLN